MFKGMFSDFTNNVMCYKITEWQLLRAASLKEQSDLVLYCFPVPIHRVITVYLSPKCLYLWLIYCILTLFLKLT